ncbi:LysR family transcriptional regulator [Marinivivus vitaminiproducens]|uniref:LysR family transcriptional regulator n=1 Tax=Marinivivus vitaminiproducens TaxID=3035935 RepID=UPI0027A549C0|nr:LysR family transcriptional regulator [Geminicoccaceae bacterium SCSIO 64248]
MEAKWLEDFLDVATTRSFSRSACQRNVTQSALSRRVRQLEAWLGVPLFDRTTYPVRLTREGDAFALRAREILDLLQASRAELRQTYRDEAEILTFATLNSLSLAFFPPWIRQLEDELGSLRTRFADQWPTFRSTIDAFVDGSADFFLTYGDEAVAPMAALAGHDYHLLGKEQVLPVSIPDERGRPMHTLVGTRKPIRYLGYGTASFFGHRLAGLFAERPLPLAVVNENAMSVGLKAMVLAGQGVAWLPRGLIADELREGRLVTAGPRGWWLTVDIRLYRAQGRVRTCTSRFWRAISGLPEPLAAPVAAQPAFA